MARKLADSYPQAPQNSCDAEEAVLQGMEVVPQNAALAAAATTAVAGKKQRGKKKKQEQDAPASKAPKGFKGSVPAVPQQGRRRL